MDPSVQRLGVLFSRLRSAGDFASKSADASELSSILVSSESLAASYISLVADLAAADIPLPVRRVAATVLRAVLATVPSLASSASEALLSLASAGVGDANAGASAGADADAIVIDVAMLCATLLRPLLLALLSARTPPADATRAWFCVAEVKNRLEDRLQRRSLDGGFFSGAASGAVAHLIVTGILVGTTSTPPPPGAPPPSETPSAADMTDGIAAAALAAVAQWEFSREFSIERVPPAHAVLRPDALAADADSASRALTTLLRQNPSAAGTEVVREEGGASSAWAGGRALVLLVRALGRLGWCRPALASTLLIPALLDFVLHPPPRLAGRSASGAIVLGDAALQAAVTHALRSLAATPQRARTLASVEAALARPELCETALPESIGTVTAADFSDFSLKKESDGGASQGGPVVDAVDLRLSVALTLPLHELVDLVMVNLAHPLPELSVEQRRAGGGNAGGAGLEALLAAVSNSAVAAPTLTAETVAALLPPPPTGVAALSRWRPSGAPLWESLGSADGCSSVRAAAQARITNALLVSQWISPSSAPVSSDSSPPLAGTALSSILGLEGNKTLDRLAALFAALPPPDGDVYRNTRASAPRRAVQRPSLCRGRCARCPSGWRAADQAFTTFPPHRSIRVLPRRRRCGRQRRRRGRPFALPFERAPPRGRPR